MTRDLLKAAEFQPNPHTPAKGFITAKIKEFDDEITRYEKEKQEIKKDAENCINEQQTLKEHNAAFATAVMLLQIAIMMSAVAALIRRKSMWYLGIVLGLVGIAYMGNGFFLWF